MMQPSLFDIPDPAPYQATSPTSRAAAEGIRPTAGTLRAVVLAAITKAGARGLTDEEGIAATGMGSSTYRPRRIELVARNLVRDSWQKRKTAAGRDAAVWCITGSEG